MSDLNVLDFGRKLAQEYITYLGTELELHATTRNFHLITLKAWGDALVQKEIIEKNPFKGIKKFKTTKTPLKYFQEHQQKLIKDHIYQKDKQLYLFVLFLEKTFLRPSQELRLLKVGDINIHTQTLNIRAEISKNNKHQSIALPRCLKDILLEMDILNYPEHYYLFGKGGEPSEKHWHKAYFYRKHKEVLDELGFSKGYSLYSWKHSGVVNSIKKGINAKFVQMQCRHHSLDETDRYMRQLVADNDSPFRDM